MRILVVEDELRVARAIKRSLEEHKFAADIVHDGDSGLTAAVDPDYDMVILDRMLPGTYDGIDIVRHMRENRIRTPVLMLTALGEINDRVTGLNEGADDYLVKPFAIKELIARTHVLLRRPLNVHSSILHIDGLTLNTETYEVHRNGTLINLSPREYKLLQYLLYNQNQTVSKDRIISHVWDADAIIMPNTVEVYIGHLRKRIDGNFPKERKLIHTMFGFGYKVSATP